MGSSKIESPFAYLGLKIEWILGRDFDKSGILDSLFNGLSGTKILTWFLGEGYYSLELFKCVNEEGKIEIFFLIYKKLLWIT